MIKTFGNMDNQTKQITKEIYQIVLAFLEKQQTLFEEYLTEVKETIKKLEE